ncbi:AAA family ATPase [Gracilibacillus alcaliphilus]|uniref:AAA family ATPase n=1 Tax=Gracilibacillus alcaliphilus TaxID=1401441 RepID=UPI001956D6CA|nr:putative kinase [Gracilibacillus alcaliphilus]
MQRLVFFVGVAGTGKTTVAEKAAARIPCAFLDRDTIGGRFVEHILKMNNMDPNDRDSQFYKENLRDLEYDSTKDICIENLRVGQNVFMISPFTAELKNKDWIDEVIAASGKSKTDVDVKVVVVTLDDMNQQRQRIQERGTVRDTWKLDNWDSYETRVDFIPAINWDIPQDHIQIFDNSGELTEEKIANLVRFLEA